MADKSLATIAQELWQGFGRNPRNVETFDALANMIPVPLGIYRGAKTLSNVDYDTLKQAYLNEAYGRNDPRVNQAAGQQLGNIAMGTLDVLPAVPLVKAGIKQAAPALARGAVGLAEKYGVSPTMAIVPPEGNLNLRPAIEEAKIKGPEKQRAGDMLRQLKNKPGVTKEALTEIRESIGNTNKVMTKKEFESHVKASQYSKVDLKQAAQGDIEHYIDMAHEQIDMSDALDYAGVPQEYQNDALMLQYGDIEFHELDPESKRILGRIYGIDETMSPENIQGALEDINYDLFHEALHDRALFLHEGDDAATAPYPYQNVQRLIASQPEGYFEFGVTHPEQRGEYRHYRSGEAPEGLIGHVRGTYSIDPAVLEGGIETLPNSYIVEEIQSDAQKIAGQTGHLRQVHGTLAKAAIQDAIEKGASHVYFPTSYPIAAVRGRPNIEYASIYDQAVMKEALNPLSQRYGIQLTPEQGRYLKTPETGSYSGMQIKEAPYYQRIELTPELKERLELEGQQTPGYAAGGLVATPRNELMHAYGSGLQILKDILNAKRQLTPLEQQLAGKYANPANQWSVGDLLLGQAPEAIKDWSYQGSSPIHGGSLQTAQFDPRLVDVAAVAVPQGQLAYKVGKAAVPHVAQAGMRQLEAMTEKYGLPSLTPSVVKAEGPSNWLPGSVESNTSRLKQLSSRVPTTAAPGRQGYTPQATALNTFVDKRLNKYIRNQMATESDPLRAMAEEGRLHFDPAEPTLGEQTNVAMRRHKAGFPAGGSAESQMARRWEILADNAIEGKPVSEWEAGADPEVLAKMPWIEHLGPGDTIFERRDPSLNYNLGFRHLTDELKNSMDATTDLPQQLRLTPKQVEQMSMERAVEHVAKINDWRAAEAAKAEMEGLQGNLAGNARHIDETFAPSFAKEQGGKWVDIPDTRDEAGLQYCTTIGKAGGWCTQGEGMANRYGSGDTRLTALLDADGRPHAQATIYESPVLPRWEDVQQYIPESLQEAAVKMPSSTPDEINAYANQLAAQKAKQAMPKDITELKPVGNSLSSDRAQTYTKRDPEYKNKISQSVVNFLNSGNWGKMPEGDLKHLGIIDVRNSKSIDEIPGIDFDAFVLAKEHAPENTPRFMTQDQFKEFLAPFSKRAGYAAGGLVDYDEDTIDQLAEGLFEAQPAEGGLKYRDYPNPYGLRAYKMKDGSYGGEMLPKYVGWAGVQEGQGPMEGSKVTEYSMDDERGSFPTINPLLSRDEVASVAAGIVTPEIYKKSVKWRDLQANYGQSAFLNPPGFAEGGKVGQPHENEYVAKASRLGRKGQYALAKVIGIDPEVEFATEIPERYYPANEQHNARGDAMRHMLLQAQLANRSPMLAKAVGWAHENLSGPQGDAEKAMDEYNDMIGREIGLRAKDKADMVWQALQAIDSRKAKTLTKEQMGEGYAEGGLVYNDAHIDRLADQLFGV